MQTLHIVNLDVLHKYYSRRGRCDRDYLSMLINDLARAGKLKRISGAVNIL